MNNRGSIEVLLLLCCLVGAVTFICLTMCAVKLQSTPKTPAPEASAGDAQSGGDSLGDLRQRIAELQERIRAKEEELAGKRPPETSADLESRIAEIRRQIEQIEEELHKRQEEMTRLKAAAAQSGDVPDPQKVADLEQQVRDLEKRLRAKQAEWEALQTPPEDQRAIEQQIAELKRKLEETVRKREALEQMKRSNAFTPGELPEGMKKYKAPLYVACTKSGVVLYSELSAKKEVLSLAEVKENNPFTARKEGHDVIVLLVRSDSFDSWMEIVEQAEASGLPVGYEPVVADRPLWFEGAAS